MSTTSSKTAPDAAAEENAVEAAKRLAARRAVADHFRPEFTHVGIGSGSTIRYVVEAIADALAAHHGGASPSPGGPPAAAAAAAAAAAVPLALRRRRASSTHGAYGIAFVPTGYQSRETIVEAGLHPVALDALPDDVRLDVAFDGADEVDADLNCIKGGGACLFQEKLVAMRARKWICVAGALSPFSPFRFTSPYSAATPFYKRLTTASRLPQGAAGAADGVALGADRGRAHRRADGAHEAATHWLRRPARAAQPAVQVGPAADRSGLLHRRRAVSRSAVETKRC